MKGIVLPTMLKFPCHTGGMGRVRWCMRALGHGLSQPVVQSHRLAMTVMRPHGFIHPHEALRVAGLPDAVEHQMPWARIPFSVTQLGRAARAEGMLFPIVPLSLEDMRQRFRTLFKLPPATELLSLPFFRKQMEPGWCLMGRKQILTSRRLIALERRPIADPASFPSYDWAEDWELPLSAHVIWACILCAEVLGVPFPRVNNVAIRCRDELPNAFRTIVWPNGTSVTLDDYSATATGSLLGALPNFVPTSDCALG